MKYLDKTRKTIKLPSGGEIEIFKLNSFNDPFLKASGNGDAEAGISISLFILTNKVGKLEFQGEVGTIVNKPAKDCAPQEIPIELLPQEDADAIIKEVLEFSGLTKAGQEARKTFPEGSETGGVPAPAGEDVRSASNHAA